MSKADLMLEALRRVNPATSTSSPIPDVADILKDDKPVWARREPPRRSKVPWVLVPVIVAVVVFASVMLSNEDRRSFDLAFPTNESGIDGRTTLDWCNADIVAYDIDPDDPASVESGYRGRLAAALVRRSLAPETLDKEAEAVAAHLQLLIEELEAIGWDLSLVDLATPPEIEEAQATLDEYTSRTC